VKAPICIDVTLRQKGNRKIIHLVNRTSGIPNNPSSGGIDEIPRVGPVTVTIKTENKPQKVNLAFEKIDITWNYSSGKLTISIPSVHIHAAVVVE
jgi:hypothetical protein